MPGDLANAHMYSYESNCVYTACLDSHKMQVLLELTVMVATYACMQGFEHFYMFIFPQAYFCYRMITHKVQCNSINVLQCLQYKPSIFSNRWRRII